MAYQPYYIGLVKRNNTVVLQARRLKDNLSCELWNYIGLRYITKAELKQNKDGLLNWINKEFGTKFTKLVID